MLGLSLNGQLTSGSTAVVIEDYLWSSASADEITPRFSDVRLNNVQDLNDAWDIGAVGDYTGGDAGGGMINAASVNEMMPATDPNPNYLSDDEGYWVVVESNATNPPLVKQQDGDGDTELTPIAVGDFPIGDGTYQA